ncbi:MAG: hypothetical protein P9M08_03000 [Candidatus Erginobacter occultus]|nr:hypothetical protein [Candidatus Erginobacter occultus]
MDNKATFWDRVEEYPLWRLLAGVFLFALSARLVVTLIFFLRWGWHTVSGIELWFYYGVAKGTFDLYSIWDPTWWVLSLIGAVFSGEALLYATYLTSSIVSSLNAAVFCLFVSELHDRKTGVMAGLIYGTMVLPMFNSAGTTTHDIYAYAWLVLALYGMLAAFRRKGWIRLPFAALALVSLWLGVHVGRTIMVSAGTVLLYLVWRGVKALAGPRFGGGYPFFLISLAVIIGVLLLAGYLLMPPLMEKIFDLAQESRGIDVRAQIRAGSGDLLGSSLGDYWLRFNFLFFFLPVGIYVAVKKKDMLGLLFLMTGYLASRTADRGTRPLSFGFALMGALAFINWKPAYGWILAAWMTYIIGEFGGRYSTEYAVFFPVCALFIYYFIQWPGEERRSGTSLLVYSLSLFAILFGFVFLSSASLRESWGLFTVPYLPGGLLKTAPGFTYLFILLGAATAALIVYTLHQGITRSRRPGWIRAMVALTLVWLFLGAVLGGAVFRAKELGKPEQLRALEGLTGLAQPEQVTAVNSVLARINGLMGFLQRYWSVQVCLLAAGLLMVLLAATRPRGEGKERQRCNAWLKITVPAACFLLGFLLLALGTEAFWKNIHFIAPPLFAILLYIFYRPQAAQVHRGYPAGAVLICWLFAAIIPSMNQTAKSTEGEYRLYSWLGQHSGGEGRVFVPWSDGYMAEAISGVKSELSPEKIDFQLPRLYWMSEEAAALALRSRSIDYIVVSSKYFKLLRYSEQSGEFQYSFSPDIIYQPQQAGINTMDRLQETALFKMLYRTRELKHFRPLHLERDPAVNETTILFEVRPGNNSP